MPGWYRRRLENGSPFARERRRLAVILAVTGLYFAIEIAGGIYTNSLALLSDAVHVLTDIGALALALFTLRIAARPATGGKTYGYLRAEILGAVLNGFFLWVLVGFIWYEAFLRLQTPKPVRGMGVMLVAAAGVLMNSLNTWFTAERSFEQGRGMAVRAAFQHAVSDLIGSVGVLISGALVYFSEWRQADPAVGILIGGLVAYGAWNLIREGVDILMEAVPAAIDLEEVRTGLLAVKGTEEVHDLHVWCLTTRQFALSAHAVVAPEADHDQVLSEMSAMLQRRFNIHHMTVQLECNSRRAVEPSHF